MRLPSPACSRPSAVVARHGCGGADRSGRPLIGRADSASAGVVAAATETTRHSPLVHLLLTSSRSSRPSDRSHPSISGVSAATRTPARSAATSAAEPVVAALTAAEPADGFVVTGATWQRQGARLDWSSASGPGPTASGRHWTEMTYDAEHGPTRARPKRRSARPGTDPFVAGDVDDVQLEARSADGSVPPGSPSTSSTQGVSRRSRRCRIGRRRSRRRPAHGGKAAATTPAGVQPITPAADHLQPRSMGRGGKPARLLRRVRRGARRLRAPHGQRQQLHRRRGAGDPARHLRLPHAEPGLARHRLQLLDRPLRPDLGGPLRRHHPAGRRRAHPELQRERLRRLGDRQLRNRPAERGDARRVRPAVRLEAQPARVSSRRRRQNVAGTAFNAISGHRDAASTACPGINLYRKIPQIIAKAAEYQSTFARPRDLPDLRRRRQSPTCSPSRAAPGSVSGQRHRAAEVRRPKAVRSDFAGMDQVVVDR